MTASLVQRAEFGRHTSAEGGGQVSATSFAATISAASAGNMLVIACTLLTPSGAAISITPSDNIGGAWRKVGYRSSNNSTSGMWCKVAAGGETTVTFTLSSTAIAVWEVREYSGVTELDAAYQDPSEAGTFATTGCTGQPKYADGLHLAWVVASDSSSQASVNSATSFTRAESGTSSGWVRHGLSGYNGVPSADTATGRTGDMRNGTYTGQLLRAWMLDKTSGTGSDKVHVSVRVGTSAFVGRSCIGAIFRTGSSPTEPEGGLGTGSASVVGNGQSAAPAVKDLTLNVPTHVAGDLLLAMVSHHSTTSISSPPSGWALWGSEWTVAQRGGEGPESSGAVEPSTWSVWYRVADGTEGGSYVWTMAGSTAPAGFMLVIRSTVGAYSGTSWQVQDPQGHQHMTGATSGYAVCSGRRPDPEADCLMMVAGAMGTAPPQGWTPVTFSGPGTYKCRWRSVAVSQAWEFREVSNARADNGMLSFVVLGKALAGGADTWAWLP